MSVNEMAAPICKDLKDLIETSSMDEGCQFAEGPIDTVVTPSDNRLILRRGDHLYRVSVFHMGNIEEVCHGDANLSPDELDDHYNVSGSGEHPVFTNRDWRDAVSKQMTTVGYWDWVQHQIHDAGAQ